MSTNESYEGPGQAPLPSLADERKQRVRFGVAVFAVVFLAAASVVLLLPRKYEATMKFLVRNARATMVVSTDRNSSLYYPEVSEAELNSEIELINTRDLLEEVARRTLLDEEDRTDLQQVDAAVSDLEEHLEVAAVRKANIISVSYAAREPDQALRVLRELSSLYLDKHLVAYKTAGAYEFFQTQAARYRDELSVIQDELSRFRTNRLLVSMETQKDLTVRETSELESRLNDLDATILGSGKRIARMRAATAAMEPTVVAEVRSVPNQFSVERLTTMLVELKNKRTMLLSKFQPGDRVITEVDQQIHDTAAHLADVQNAPSIETTRSPNPVRVSLMEDLAKAEVELEGLTAERTGMEQYYQDLRRRVVALEASTPAHNRLEHEVEMAEANVELYEAKREEARIAEALDRDKISNISIAQRPTVPVDPAGPSRALLLAASVILAAFMGLGGMLIAEFVAQDAAGTGWLVPFGVPAPRHERTPAPTRSVEWPASPLAARH